jgi:tetratricopeptide (TPR) repeat protein
MRLSGATRWVWVAIFILATVPTLAKTGVSGYYAQCQTLYAKKVLDAAQSTCQLALTLDPDHLPSLKLISRILLEQNNPAKAASYLSKLATLAPTDPESRLLRAKSHLRAGKAGEAYGLLRGIGGSEAALLRAEAQETLGQYEEALNSYRQAFTLVDGRLGAARMSQRLGKLEDGIAVLSNTTREALLKAELQWAKGQLGSAAKNLESVLPRLGPLDPDYTRTLNLLAMVYYGQGNTQKGGLVMRQLASRSSLPTILLGYIWPWIAAFVIYLGLILFGESQIEPMRTVELTDEVRHGPGSLHLWILGSVLIAGVASAWIGQTLYSNWLAAFTPVQSDVARTLFYVILGVAGAVILYTRTGLKPLQKLLEQRQTWVEGVAAGLGLVALLLVYGYVRNNLGLGSLPLNYAVFVGFAFLELVIQGVGSGILQDRYRQLTNLMIPILFALAIPGPTLYFAVAAFLMAWLRRRTRGALAGMVAWLVAGIIVSLISSIPLVRTLL